ncbi:MAG: SpoIIE family protein phosphatase [Vicingaceae bacterium]|nr:SpoIIE family protein phosphatase [Vicingaceae bacterium]
MLLGLLSSICLKAQNELGKPYIKNFNSDKYKISNTVWDITQDNKGLMYFGTSAGIQQFDGSSFRLIKIDNETTVRSLDVDENGKVFVGGKGEFGYLRQDSLGLTKYVSLSQNLAEKHKDFADVWNTYVTKDGVFFLSFKKIFRYHNNQIKVYEHDVYAHLGFYVNENMYVILKEHGLSVFKNDDFIPVPGGEYYKGKSTFAIFPYNEDNIIIATRANGLERFNIETGDVFSFADQVNPKIIDARMYHGAISEKGDYMIGTLNNGVYVIDTEGNLVMNINQDNGLHSNNIKYLFKDYHGGIWVGSAMGISYVDLNLPVTYFDSENGINGYCRDVVRHNGILYLATGNGVFYLDKYEDDPGKKFKRLEGFDGQFWNFCVSENNKLLVGGDGLFKIEDKKLSYIRRFGKIACFAILNSKKNPNIFYLALKNGLAIAKYNEDMDQIKVIHKFENFSDECHHLAEDKNGDLWVQTAYNYVLKVNANSFNENEGFPLSYKKYETSEKIAGEQIISIDDQIFFPSSQGLLTFNNEIDTFELTELPFNIPLDYKVNRLIKDNDDNIWLHYHSSGKSGEALAIRNNEESYSVSFDPFLRFREKISHLQSPFIDSSNIAWFIGGEGVIRYDYSKDLLERKDYNVNIRQVSLNTDSIINYGDNLLSTDFVFSFNNNATSFTFSAATYNNDDEVYYQYFLEGGQDEEWSEWTKQNSKEYNFLHEGEYIFKVRAKNVYNQISDEDEFTFVILPPWYRENWAYVVYGLLFLILIFLIIKIATYRLQKSKRQLELIVEERTKDIVKEKEKVEEQKLLIEEVHSELSERNKDVMDSIKYAKRIQSSILPPLDKLKSEFKESFVLYKPRDIVSGDFYWYEKVGDYLIMACADCTGHGVPGAFMSMIGATLLNKIVEQDNIDHCKDALNELDKEIVKTLQQTSISDNNTSMDGMDISLIAVNQKLMECHYSGAYRPLYIIRDNEIIIYKANRQSIGGGLNKHESFTGASFKLKSGDLLYMFTDGVVDQFGGEKNKKYKTERLKKLLLKICNQNLENQSKIIDEEFETWKGDNEQIDDVLITGIKIP